MFSFSCIITYRHMKGNTSHFIQSSYRAGRKPDNNLAILSFIYETHPPTYISHISFITDELKTKSRQLSRISDTSCPLTKIGRSVTQFRNSQIIGSVLLCIVRGLDKYPFALWIHIFQGMCFKISSVVSAACANKLETSLHVSVCELTARFN